jgi:hypothetical protein
VTPTDTEVVIHEKAPAIPPDTSPLEKSNTDAQGTKSVVVLDKSSLMPLLYILAAVLLLGVFGGLVFMFIDKQPKEEKRFLLVQSQTEEDDNKGPSEAARVDAPNEDESTGKGAKTEDPTKEEDPKAEAPPVEEAAKAPDRKHQKSQQNRDKKSEEASGPDMRALTLAFKKRKGRIHKCFEDHPQDLDNAPKMSVLFHLASSGKVTSVNLAPKHMTGTSLGKCLVGVSRATVFPAQKEAISFRIPLSASKVQK